MSDLIAVFGNLYTIHRYAAPDLSGGQAQQPMEVLNNGDPFTMVASIQHLTPFQMSLLPEGMRNRSMVKVYTYADLQVTDEDLGTIADRFTWNGKNYEVLSLMDWEGTALSHRKYLAAKVEVA